MASRKTKAKPGNIFDAFIKSMFGRVLVFVELLQHYGDHKFVSQIDSRKTKPAPTHYIGEKGDERIVDLVFQCPLKNGNGTLMAVIIFEHQGGSLKNIPRKLHKYISSIWDAETKEGKKTLSAPYFLVLRTGKKPHRGRYPMMSDSLPKDAAGTPVGRIPEIEYDVLDLPAWEVGQLVGGPILRLALGVLKKMTDAFGEDFSEALLPLLEILDENDRLELTRETLEFIAKVFASRDLRLGPAAVSKALKPILRSKEKFMIKTIFEEKFDQGVAEGEARGEAKALIAFLTARFQTVPKAIADRITSMNDSVALESLVVHAATCGSLEEFAEHLP